MTDNATADTPPLLERTFRVDGLDHVVRLGAVAWAAFDDACEREGLAGDALCARAAQRIGDEPLADKLLGLLTAYFKDAADADPPPPPGFSEEDGAAPPLSPALRAALDAVGR